MTNATERQWQWIVEKLRAALAGELIIGSELGRGGMAAVFLAYDTHLARRVAVKVMAPELLVSEELVERFSAEAATMANFRHPNIVTVHAVRTVEDIRFFVMEFIAGRPLDRILGHTGPLSLAMTRGIVSQVGSALAYAHRRGVTHRDVKPGNILVDQEGTALVTDFGIAKAVESSSRTHTGMLLGTPAYMSPEQCLGLPVSPASDQYSLGVVVYEMLTGRLPFEGIPFVAMQGHTLHPVPPPRTLRPDLPEDVERALLRMLAKEADGRWPSMRDALEALGARPLDENDPLRAELAMLALIGDAPVATYESLTPPGTSGGGEASIAPAAAVAERRYLVVSDPPVAIAPGDEFRMAAFVCRENGTIVEHRSVAWTSSDPRIARVDQATGVVRAIAAGDVRLVAAADDLVGDVAMHVRSVAVQPDGHRRRYRVAIGAAALLGAASIGVLAVMNGGEPSRVEPVPTTIAEAPTDDGIVVLEGVRVSAVVEVDSTPRPTPRDDVRQPIRVPQPATREVTQALAVPPTVPSPVTTMSERAESVVVRVPERPSEESLRAVTSRCASALESKSAEQLAAIVAADDATAADLRALLAVMRDEGAQLRVSQLVYDAREIAETSASEEIEARLTWRSSFGRTRGAVVRLRGGIKSTPSGWEPTACQIVRATGLR